MNRQDETEALALLGGAPLFEGLAAEALAEVLRRVRRRRVEVGRKYVEAYLDYVHYVERIRADAAGATHHGEGETVPAQPHAN